MDDVRISTTLSNNVRLNATKNIICQNAKKIHSNWHFKTIFLNIYIDKIRYDSTRFAGFQSNTARPIPTGNQL